MSGPTPSGFDGLTVAVFEARMAGPLADLVRKHGGVPLAAPALREVPLTENPDAQAFVDGLLAGRFDVVIFETGVGIRYLVESVEARLPRDAWPAALAKPSVVVRGPKPAAALRELGVTADFQVPEPNTWRETLALLDERRPVAGARVAVQEYGKPVPDLTRGLELRGAVVTSVPVYRWALPEDITPLREALTQIIAGRVGAALFTSAQQVEHVLQIADDDGRETAVRKAIERHVVVGSVGPTTSEALRAHDLPVDIEPERPKSAPLVAAVAAGWRAVGKAGPPG